MESELGENPPRVRLRRVLRGDTYSRQFGAGKFALAPVDQVGYVVQVGSQGEVFISDEELVRARRSRMAVDVTKRKG